MSCEVAWKRGRVDACREHVGVSVHVSVLLRVLLALVVWASVSCFGQHVGTVQDQGGRGQCLINVISKGEGGGGGHSARTHAIFRSPQALRENVDLSSC